MKVFKSLFLLFLIFSLNSGFAQYWLEISDRLPAGSGGGTLTDVCFFGDTGWVVNYNPSVTQGELFYTTDAGESFSRITLPYIPRRIFMVNKDKGYVGCNNGRLLFTPDGWQSWAYTNGTLGVMIEGITIAPGADTGYCCGGDSWIGLFDSTGFVDTYLLYKINLHDISFPADTGQGWVCGDNSTLSRYYNGSWQTLTMPYAQSYYGLYFLPGTSTGWAAGGQDWSMFPVISHTTDGMNWVKQTHPITDGIFYEIHMVNELHGWVAGNHILHTQDGGSTWTEQAQDFPNTWRAIFAVHENLAYAVGNDKRILKYDIWEGIDESAGDFTVAVYPNPALEQIHIHTGYQGNDEVMVSIFETSGKRVLTKSIIPAEGACSLNLQGLNEGLYILNVRIGNNDTSVRLMLMRP